MKSHQNSIPPANSALALQNALGMLRQTNDAPKWSMGGIGGVTPDGDAAGAYGVYRRGLTDGELDPPPRAMPNRFAPR